MMKRKSKGMALAIVICAMALVIALGTAALVAANSAFATSTENISQQQAYLAACSYCDVLKDVLNNSSDPITERAELLADSESISISADSANAGGLGTAECTIERTGASLKVTVDALYNGEHCKLAMRMKKEPSGWALDTFLKVD